MASGIYGETHQLLILLAFNFDTHIKTISPLSITWSMMLCCSVFLAMFQLDAASAHPHPSLVSDKHIPVELSTSYNPVSRWGLLKTPHVVV